MSDQILLSDKLGNILEIINQVRESAETWCVLYISENLDEDNLTKDTPCWVICVTDEDALVYIPQFAQQNKLEVLSDVWLVKDIVDQLRFRRPKSSTDDLVLALKFYLNNDAFIP
jgi:hypothetical protein